MIAKFNLGQIVATPRAVEALTRSQLSVDEILARHVAGDWGDVSDEQWGLNELSLLEELALISTYATALGDRVTVFTRADRSYTLVHLAPYPPAAGHQTSTDLYRVGGGDG